MTDKLLVRPNPFFDESFLGYIIRLTEQNGYESPGDFLHLLPNSNNTLIRKSTRIEKFINPSQDLLQHLENFCKKNLQILLDLTAFPFEKSDKSLIKNNRKFLHTGFQKFCPVCIREENYHRKIWDLLLVTVCPIHNCTIKNICPNCKKLLKPSRRFVCKCECNFDFRDMEPTLIPEADTHLTKYIYCMTGLWESNRFSLSLNNPLINHPLDEIFTVIYHFIKRFFTLRFESSFSFGKLIIQEDLHQLVVKAFSIFENYPKNYLSYLERLIQHKSFFNKNLWHLFFAPDYNNFYHTIPNSLITLLFKTFDENFPLIAAKYKRNVSQTTNSKSISASNLAYQLNIENQVIYELIDNGDFLQVKIKPGKYGEICCFEGDEFYRIMNKIRSQKKHISADKEERIINLTQINEFLSKSGIKLQKFLSFVFKGQIQFCYEDLNAKGLHRFLFSEKDLLILYKN
ncbi:MAG: TniQ family protein [Pyrinomonadaceae bacterium]|nr:TniQ family protein [Pyrinomonadaceae bacterium]